MAVEDQIRQMADFRTLFLTSIVTALSFVVALFWRDAITQTIDQIIPKGESIFYKYAAAVAVTIIVVIVAYVLIRSQRLAEERMKKIAKKKR